MSTYQEYLERIRKYEEPWDTLDHVPEKFRDRKMCLAGVQHKGITLEYVPDALKDKEICLTAVQQDGRALQFVPESVSDREIRLAAVQEAGWVLRYVPEKLRDRELCLAAVKRYGGALEYVPEKLRDEEICLTAVNDTIRAIDFVPDRILVTSNEKILRRRVTTFDLWYSNPEVLNDFVDVYNTMSSHDGALNLGEAFLANGLKTPCIFVRKDDDICYALNPSCYSFWTITKTNMIQLLTANDVGLEMGKYNTLDEAFDAFVRISSDNAVQTYEEMKQGCETSVRCGA